METDWQRLDERAIPYASTLRWIRVAVLSLVFLVVGVLAWADRWLTPSLRLALAGAFLLLLGLEVVLAFVMPRLEHRHTRYRVDERGLEIARGVLWRSVVTVARSRVQHLDVTQGPLERSYGLARLHVHTAGTHDAVVSLPGIAHETAKALRDDLGAWTAADDGV